MVAASTLAELAMLVMKNSKDVAGIIDAAGVVVTATSALMKEIKPVLEDIDVEAITRKARSVAEAAAQSADAAGSKAKNAAGEAADVANSILSKLGDIKDDALASRETAKSEKELRKAIREARQSVLENATSSMTISDLEKAAEKSADLAIGPISDMPGCFVIATYKKLDFDKDLTDYTGIYVGKAENAAEGVSRAISRDGDPDVYADVKFKQNVHVYVYNCLADDLDERYSSLCQIFSGDELYNAR